MADSGTPTASLSVDDSEETRIDDGSDQDSVTSELSTEDYAVSLKDDLVKALNELKALRRSAALERSSTKVLRHTLRKWLQEPEESRQNGLYYPLDYIYTESRIKLSTLAESDKVLGRVLDSLSKELDFEVFIAQLEREEVGYDEVGHSKFYDRYPESEEKSEEESYHFMDEVLETTHQVKTVQDMHGEPVANGLDLDPDRDILVPNEDVYINVFEDVTPEEKYEKETEGWYGRSVRISGFPTFHLHRCKLLLTSPFNRDRH